MVITLRRKNAQDEGGIEGPVALGTTLYKMRRIVTARKLSMDLVTHDA